MLPEDQYSSTVEDYLKAIYSLSREEGAGVEVVPLGGIAEKLAVTPGTVTTMMRHLADRGLVDYQPRKGVILNGKGNEEAIRIVRRHRMVELFLVNVMELDWAHVHEEAEALEHVVSDRLLDRMDEMLGYPSHDPHGDPIPDAEGSIPDEASQPLSSCMPGTWVVVRILDDNASFLNWLEQKGLQPGNALSLHEVDNLAGTLSLEVENRELTMGVVPAHAVLVRAG